jgi:predicted nucleotidyltransferase
MKDFFVDLKNYLIEKYNCDSIILYGSYARGDYTKESDIDILCLRKNDIEVNDTSLFQGKILDVWIKSSKKEISPKNFLHVRDGKVLFDKTFEGEKLLNEIKKYFDNGPPKLDKGQKKFLIDWINKMYNRSLKGDVEGKYRYYWLTKDILEIYFELNNQWYEGPKKSLRWLEENDSHIFNLYKLVLSDEVPSINMKLLIDELSVI